MERVYVVVYGLSCCPQFEIIQKDAPGVISSYGFAIGDGIIYSSGFFHLQCRL